MGSCKMNTCVPAFHNQDMETDGDVTEFNSITA